jgi:hypothetical protein
MLSTLLIVAVSVVLAAVFFLLPAVRSGIITTVVAVRDFILFVLRQIARFVIYLISLIPYQEPDGELTLPDPGNMGTLEAAEEAEAFTVNMGLIMTIIAIILTVIAVAVILKFRKLRMKRVAPVVNLQKEKIDGASLAQLLADALRRLLKKIQFLKQYIAKRKTPEGAFIRLAHQAARRGVPKQTAETPREYLNRIRACLSPGFADDPAADRLFGSMVVRIDLRCFSGETMPFEVLEQSELQLLSRIKKGLGKNKRR